MPQWFQMAIDKASIDRAFQFIPNTPDQDEDIAAVYDAAHRLAEEIHRRVAEPYAEQSISQLMGLLTLSKTAIEAKPRQARPILVV